MFWLFSVSVLQLAWSAKAAVLCLPPRRYGLGGTSARAQVAQHSKLTDCKFGSQEL